MTTPRNRRTPFVLGTPIKEPDDFYGRQDTLAQLYRIVQDKQMVSVVGEHRCGNTSVLYQLLHPDVRARHLKPEEDAQLVWAFISAQLASESPEAFLRRIARVVRRSDRDVEAEYGEEIDQAWLEAYLEGLAVRKKRLVLLIDEFEVLAHFDPLFWEWFQVLAVEYDVTVVASTRTDLGQYRTETGTGPQFFNMFRSLYIGSFTPEEVDEYLADTAALTEFDFQKVKGEIGDLAGRFPYYIQVAAALLYTHAGSEGRLSPSELDAVRAEFRLRTQMLFGDAWQKLPAAEREALTWLVLAAQPAGRDEVRFAHAMHSLERRGYVVDGHIFSSALADYVHNLLRRIGPSTTHGAVRVGRALVELPPKELALVHFWLDHTEQVTTIDQIALAVWPEFTREGPGIAEAAIQRTVEQLRKVIEGRKDGGEHIEGMAEGGYIFHNPRLEEVGAGGG